MKNKLIHRMYVILIINVILVAASVYGIVYFMSVNAMMDDIRQRAEGVTDFIFENIGKDANYIKNIDKQGDEGDEARVYIEKVFEQAQMAGNLKRLYIAKISPSGLIVTNSGAKNGGDYAPSGKTETDLRKSHETGKPVFASRIYKDEDGKGIYTVFIPVSEENTGTQLGVVSMEFDVDIIYKSNADSAVYSLALSGTLIFLFFIIAFLAMSKASEPFYKKLAYTDVLTGYENRMAFEHRLRESHAIADRGESVAIVVYDVNNLKTVNDKQGHEAGDKYLKITADILFEHLPKGSKLYRIGGDEYATILVGIKERDLADLMLAYRNENRQTVKNQPFSCACGAAIFIRGLDENMRDVFKRADEAMYTEKKRQKALLGQELR